MKFQCIDENRKLFPIWLMTKLFGVSKSGYHKWKTRSEKRVNETLKLLRTIEEIHRASRKNYGSPRIYEQLRGLGFKGKSSTLHTFHG